MDGNSRLLEIVPSVADSEFGIAYSWFGRQWASLRILQQNLSLGDGNISRLRQTVARHGGWVILQEPIRAGTEVSAKTIF